MVHVSRAARTSATSSPSYLAIPGPSVPHYRRRIQTYIRDRPDVFLANGRTLIQPRLPPLFGHVGLAETTRQRNADEDRPNVDAGEEDPFLLASERSPPPADRTQHRRKREAQWRRWQGEVIPKLLPHFVRVMHQSKSFRDYDALELPAGSSTPCACASSRTCKVAIVRFTGKWALVCEFYSLLTILAAVDDVELRVCACTPAAVQLMYAGAFPCAPLAPTLAVDLRVLEFAMNLFVQIAPNNTALTMTLERVLGSMGFQLEHQVCRASMANQASADLEGRSLCGDDSAIHSCGTRTYELKPKSTMLRSSKPRVYSS